MRVHAHLGKVREGETGACAKVLDKGENVIPASAVEPRRVVPQFVQNFVEFESREDGLDQHRSFNAALGNTQFGLCVYEHVVPQPGFEVAFELGKVKIGPRSLGQQLLGIVEEVQTKIDQTGAHRFARAVEVLLFQVPAPGADHQRGGPLLEAILLTRFGVGKADGTIDGIAQVDLTTDGIFPVQNQP